MKYIRLYEERYRQRKFSVNDYVKRKSDGRIGKVLSYSVRSFGNEIDYSTLKYSVKFGKETEYFIDSEELEKPTQDEIKLYLDIEKYNL